LILGASSAALAETPTFPKNLPYATARESLVKQGWRPIHTPDPGFVCEKGDRRCKGRPETVDCAGTGLANCFFRWKKKKTVIEITTAGGQSEGQFRHVQGQLPLACGSRMLPANLRSRQGEPLDNVSPSLQK